MSSPLQVYRIDHYLGKEMAQNLLIMRFYNSFISPCWNREHISNVQICFKACPLSVLVMHRSIHSMLTCMRVPRSPLGLRAAEGTLTSLVLSETLCRTTLCKFWRS